MAGKTFSGNLRITPVNKLGVAIGAAIGLLNTVKLELVVPAPDNVDQISRMNGTVGQLASRAQVPKPTTLNVSIDDLDDQRILAFALNGVAVSYAQSSATVTAEAITAPAKLGDAVPLAHRHVTVTSVKTADDATTYVVNTDYVVDSKTGFITFPVGSSVVPSSALHVAYSAAVIAGTTVRGATVASTLLRVDVQMDNLVDLSEAYFVCPIYQASSSGNQDLFGKNMLVAALSGAMFLPPAGSAAYTETGGAPFIITQVT